MGSGLPHLLASKGVRSPSAARDPAQASRFAEEIGASAQGGGIAAAVKLAGIVTLAV